MITDLQVKQSQHEARVLVTVFELVGEMDSSNVEQFQTEAQLDARRSSSTAYCHI